MKKIIAVFLIASVAFSIVFETDMSLAKSKRRPAQVRGLRAVKVRNSSVLLKWKRAKRARKYIVYRAKGKYGRFVKRAVTRKPLFKDYRVRRNTVYRYYVRGYNRKAGRRSSIVRVRTKLYAPVVKRWYIGGDGETDYSEATAGKNVVAILHYDGLFRVVGSGNTAPFVANSPWFYAYVNGVSCNNRIRRVYIGPNVRATNLVHWFFGCESLKSINRIPATAKGINYMFYGCSKLKFAPRIPSNVEKMRFTFEYCKSLKRAPKLPEGVVNLENSFAGCNSLIKAPEIPLTAENIDLMFYHCKNLKTASKIPANNNIKTAIGTYSRCKKLTGVFNVEGGLGSAGTSYFFDDCSTDKKAKLRIRYDGSNSSVKDTVNKLYKTKSPNSNIVKAPY